MTEEVPTPRSSSEDRPLHDHVTRQLRRVGLDPDGPPPSADAWMKFLHSVSTAYEDIDKDRYLNDRAWAVSSVEMQQLYVQLAETSASELALERDRLTTVLNTTTTGLCLIDSDQKIAEINAAGAFFLAATREEALGASLLDLLWPGGESRSRDIAPAELRIALTTHKSWRADLVQVRISPQKSLTCSIVYTPLSLGDSNVPGGVLAFHDFTQQHRAEEDLAWRATHDPLTGLLNRSSFTRYVDNALEMAKRMQYRCAMLFIDLDRFKTINDTIGHDAGDTAIVEAADRVRRTVRTQDTVARLGGDEFVVFLENVTGMIDAEIVAERVVSTLRQPFVISGEEMFLSASVGLALSEPDQDASSMLRDADIALYEAKGAGRDRVRAFGQELRRVVEQRVELDRMLRAAIGQGELSVAYQPIVRLSDANTVGFEALARWNTSAGSIGPERFIPVAEETGMIFDIGSFVLKQATGFASELRAGSHNWPESGTAMSMNVSGVQLARRGFADAVARQLEILEIPGSALIVELTESALLADKGSVRTELEQLRKLGVLVALDDFGTGWSSLSLLQQFPLDCMKIDRGFVSKMTTNSDDFAIVQAVITLGHALGHVVIAEGVEVAEQASALRDLGCDLAQGFYFGRPGDVTGAIAYLATTTGTARAS